MRYKVINRSCKLVRMRNGDAGYDLCAGVSIKIPPHESAVVPLGIALAIPKGHYGLLTHRSSLAFKKNGILSTGIIDSNFKQELKAKVFNISAFRELVIEEGERIAQIIIHKYVSPELEEVKEMEDGKGGFGSSGV